MEWAEAGRVYCVCARAPRVFGVFGKCGGWRQFCRVKHKCTQKNVIIIYVDESEFQREQNLFGFLNFLFSGKSRIVNTSDIRAHVKNSSSSHLK